MSKRMIGLLLLLVASILFGLVLSELFFRLFLRTVPPLAVSQFNQSAAHVAFMFYGLGAGVAAFIWSVLVALVARVFAPRKP